MNLDGISDRGCRLLYSVNKDPLPENPCTECYCAKTGAGCTIRVCSKRDSYLAEIKPYRECGIADVAELLSAYRRNAGRKAELSAEIQRRSRENTDILQKLPAVLSEAVKTGILPERLSEDGVVDGLLVRAVKSPVPDNPCTLCPEKYSGMCYDCGKEQRYTLAVKPYRDAGILETAGQISAYYHNLDESAGLDRRIAGISAEIRTILEKLPAGIGSVLKRGKQLEAERVQQEKKKNEMHDTEGRTALEERETRMLTVLVSQYFELCDRIRNLEECKKRLLDRMPEELADKVLAGECMRGKGE